MSGKPIDASLKETALFTLTPGGYFLAHNSTLVGDVTVGREASLWFNAVVRGDVAPVVIGQRVNVQDGTIIHCDTGEPNVIEDDVTIGHRAIVHGAFVGRGALIGMGSVLLGRTRIGRGAMVAAGAVVPPGLEVPDNMLVVGVPGRIVRAVSDKDRRYMQWLSGHYVELARRYAAGEDVRPIPGEKLPE